MENTKPLLQDVFSLSLDCLEGEEWVDAIGFDGIYEVSNLGRIKSLGRYVNIKNGQRWVKEKIRKQTLGNDGRLTCPLNDKSINVAATIFLSFYPNAKYNPKVNCIMHKNKIQYDNRIDNLEIQTISESHCINYKKGLLPHLKINHLKRTEDYNLLKNRDCKVCKKNKLISKFKRGCRICRNCEYLKKSNPNYRQFSEIKIKCLDDGNILTFKNSIELQESKIISRPTFRNLMKAENKIFKSFKNKKEYLIISVS